MCGMKILRLMAETKITIHKLDGNLYHYNIENQIEFP